MGVVGLSLWWSLAVVVVVVAFVARRASAAGKLPTARDVVRRFGGEGKHLKGKTALVTGGNAGIGLETVKALASAGCRVILCSRNIDAANAAIAKEIKQEGLGGYRVEDTSNIIVKRLDLEDLDSVRSLAEDVLATEKSLDLLINNAGIMSLPTLERTKAGWEKQMGVNHFAHALLTNRLIPLLAKSPSARVVALASTAHRFATKKVLSDPCYAKGTKYVPWGAYGDSKLANLLWAKGLARDLEQKGLSRVNVVSVHPGVIRTALWNQSPLNRFFSLFVGDRDIPQGAASTVWAAVCPRVSEPEMRGAYISDCAPARPNELGTDPELVDRVWRVTEEEIQRVGR